MSKLIPAVGCLRRSDDSSTQEKSIPEQTVEVQKYADEKGYHIIRWYTDDAISGDDSDSRKGFLQMLQDAQELRDFKAIICWDGARFTRVDSTEYGYYVHPLRKAGVYLATVTGGITDWNDSAGRIVANVMQEGRHQFLIDHSANVARGQKGAIANGGWVGSPPYAYRLEGKKYNKRLLIDDINKANIVRRIFREFTEEGRPMTSIAERLNSDGVVSPNAHVHGWHSDTIKCIVENPAYCGDFVAGRSSYGKYHRIKKGNVVKAPGAGKRKRNVEEEWTVRRDTHEAIIERPVFEKAKGILERNREDKRRRKAPEKSAYILIGALRCGKCSYPLHGMTSNSHFRYYECSCRKRHGDGGCIGTTVREDVVLLSLADFLEGWLNVDELGTARLVMNVYFD